MASSCTYKNECFSPQRSLRKRWSRFAGAVLENSATLEDAAVFFLVSCFESVATVLAPLFFSVYGLFGTHLHVVTKEHP